MHSLPRSAWLVPRSAQLLAISGSVLLHVALLLIVARYFAPPALRWTPPGVSGGALHLIRLIAAPTAAPLPGTKQAQTPKRSIEATTPAPETPISTVATDTAPQPTAQPSPNAGNDAKPAQIESAAPASGRSPFGIAAPQHGGYDAQAMYLQQMQYQAQMALQASMQAQRGQFEQRLIQSLRAVELASACHLQVSPDGAVLRQCEDARDTDTLKAVLQTTGNPPLTPIENNWLDIHLRPNAEGGTALVAQHTDRQSALALPE